MLQVDVEPWREAPVRPPPRVAASVRAVFIDKDGTLVENVPFNVDPAAIRLTAGAGAALRRLSDAGYRLFVVSNQPGIGRGLFSHRQLKDAFTWINRLLRPSGVAIESFYYCPHESGFGCACRKPAEGLIARAAARHALDLSQSWMIGDILNDVEAGRRAGCRTVLIDNGNETEWERGALRMPDAMAPDLTAAVDAILSEAGGSPWA